MCYTAVLIGIIVLILVLYSAIGRPHVAYITVPLITGNNLQKPYCTTSMPGFDYALYAIEGNQRIPSSQPIDTKNTTY